MDVHDVGPPDLAPQRDQQPRREQRERHAEPLLEAVPRAHPDGAHAVLVARARPAVQALLSTATCQPRVAQPLGLRGDHRLQTADVRAAPGARRAAPEREGGHGGQSRVTVREVCRPRNQPVHLPRCLGAHCDTRDRAHAIDVPTRTVDSRRHRAGTQRRRCAGSSACSVTARRCVALAALAVPGFRDQVALSATPPAAALRRALLRPRRRRHRQAVCTAQGAAVDVRFVVAQPPRGARRTSPTVGHPSARARAARGHGSVGSTPGETAEVTQDLRRGPRGAYDVSVRLPALRPAAARALPGTAASADEGRASSRPRFPPDARRRGGVRRAGSPRPCARRPVTTSP